MINPEKVYNWPPINGTWIAEEAEQWWTSTIAPQPAPHLTLSDGIGTLIVGDGVDVAAELKALREMINPVAVVKCQHCGQWAARYTSCKHCGAPID